MKFKSNSIYNILMILLPLIGMAQELSISGTVKDIKNEPISFANAVLLTAEDSTVVNGTSSNDKGYFVINKVHEGRYVLKVSFIGYGHFLKSIEVGSEDISLGGIILEEDSEALNEVSIVATKPTVKKEADRLIFNVEHTALSEGNLLEVVKNTPGVFVFDGSILVKNSAPTVYINDRKVQLSSEEIIQLLEGSPANSIKSVEVITNPPASYDADSGIVLNIVMTKNLVTGYRGSVYGNYTQGVFPRYNGGLSQYFKTSKINFFANYNYTHNKINRDNADDVFYLDSNNQINEKWVSAVNRNTWSKSHTFNFNLDFLFDSNNTLSLSSNILWTPYFKYKIDNNTRILNANDQFLSRFSTNSNFDDDKYNLGFDVDFVHKFKEGNGSLSYNSHFTTYDYDRIQKANSQYYDQNDMFVNPTAFRTDANQKTNVFTSKLDYNLPIKETAVFDAGVKFSNIKTESDIEKVDFDFNTSQNVLNTAYTNAFDYDETVFAAYTNFSKDWSKWNLSAGLRLEQTDIKGVSATTNQTNKQSYLEWFPTASLKFQPSDNFSVYVNYKRSINRPDYKDLNPFTFFLNDNTLVVGNPNLKPVFVDHFILGTGITKYLTVEAYYKKSNGNIYQLSRQDNVNNQIVFTPINVDKTVEYGFDFVTYFNVTPSWFLYAVTSFYNSQDRAVFTQGEIALDKWSNYSVISNSFSFLKDKSLSVNATITYLSSYLASLSVVDDRFLSELAISKTILKKKGVISLSANDLLNKEDFKVTTQYANQFSHYNTDQDTRYVKLGFRYKFGNTKLQTNERQKEVKETERIKDLD